VLHKNNTDFGRPEIPDRLYCLYSKQTEQNMWEANSLDHSDTRWGVSRTVVNAQGLFQLEKFPKTFRTYESAVAQVNKLNGVA
jgi:hypothetical protein